MKLVSTLSLVASATASNTFDVQAGLNTGRADILSQYLPNHAVAQHGCWCSKIADDLHLSVTVFDDLDDLCRQWQQMRGCIYLEGGACYEQDGQDAYVMNEDRTCDATVNGGENSCAHTACQIDAQFITLINNKVDDGASVTNIPVALKNCHTGSLSIC